MGFEVAGNQPDDQKFQPLDGVACGAPRRFTGEYIWPWPVPERRHVAVERIEIEVQIHSECPRQRGIAGCRAARQAHQRGEQVGGARRIRAAAEHVQAVTNLQFLEFAQIAVEPVQRNV